MKLWCEFIREYINRRNSAFFYKIERGRRYAYSVMFFNKSSVRFQNKYVKKRNNFCYKAENSQREAGREDSHAGKKWVRLQVPPERPVLTREGESLPAGPFGPRALCWFPSTAVTSNHSLGDLMQQKFILSSSEGHRFQVQEPAEQCSR